MTIVHLTNGDGHHGEPEPVISTDVLIIGTGPAGASLAGFLAMHGIRGIMVSSAPGSADTPRAHFTNMAAMECLRDIGLEKECKRLGTNGSHMINTRWAYSMAGEEYMRSYSWGNDPKRKGDYETASPCEPLDLPQTLLEPILVRHATLNGFTCRFDTTFVHFTENANGTISTLRDNVSGLEYKVQSKYLFGADGARSQVFRQLGLELDVKPDQGTAFNVLIRADLSRYMEHREGTLHWLLQPDKEHPVFGWAGIARMVKPWNEWLFIVIPDRQNGLTRMPTEEEWVQRMKEWIGDDSIPVELINVSKWRLNEVVAKTYSKGRVFCLGDAVHRHPPSNGLGSNTCIQDAYNLAWKIAYVLKGQASSSLLDTYSVERQPVGSGIVARANESFRHHGPIWEAFGVSLPTPEERMQALHQLTLPTEEGRTRRKNLQAALEEAQHEYHALGREMGQFYQSKAIYSDDETEPYYTPELLAQDQDLIYHRSTYPGRRLPHVWLNKRIPGEPISTVDLAGHGAFTILTGIGGDAWKIAASQVGESLGVPINAYSIGFRQDYEDFYFDWARIRQVDETGCILVRPDRMVGWRCQEVLGDEALCTDKLRHVVLSILGRDS
ncbi:hypothetical protein DTO207G8_1956 [Paecilomyces variotii]|nr:hypothetical protein DTO207G8_1956 [Paecilomyces variotii]KAJ9352256.1 hypothetical protein DTO027B9_5957 [Paecilomyces variotii]KAJ9372459.1 hypothetical protein DTO282E5_2786 [Paecilomyces variotii]